MQNISPRVVGRRALIKGTAMLAVAATARVQGQPPPADQSTTLADVPLGPSVTVTVERRSDIVLVGLNRPSIRARHIAPCAGRIEHAAPYTNGIWHNGCGGSSAPCRAPPRSS